MLGTVRQAAPSSSLSDSGQPTRIGTARLLPQTADADVLMAQLAWQPSAAGGRIATIRFQSSKARGVRLALRVERLPLGGVIRFRADGSAQSFELSAREALALIERNLGAGAAGEAAHTLWSPNLHGDAITMDLELPPGADPAAFRLSVPRLSHVYDDPREAPSVAGEDRVGTNKTSACSLDVSCQPEYDEESRAVALMEFVKDDGNTYLCTGTLLNDSASSGTPYFLGANHCISAQTEASSLTTYWFYRSASCDSKVIGSGIRSVTSGAVLLYASASTDTSFMRLNGTPPVGAVYAGSRIDTVSIGADVLGLHHPEGGPQKYSIGAATDFAVCQGGSSFSCQRSDSADGNYLVVIWRAGVTGAGSSGSGLFMTEAGKRYLVGQLRGGSSSCDATSGADVYGRFDVAYNAALATWLNAPTAPQRTGVFRFYNVGSGVHFYTASARERDALVAANVDYVYEGPVFYAYGAPVAGSSAVFRFVDTRSSAHFYTGSLAERSYVADSYPEYHDEGIGWYADASAGGGSVPIYRFYNSSTGTHFYTASANERDEVIARYRQFEFEGIAYQAWTSAANEARVGP
ncbi:MAG: serine protease [Variovorax sp.]